MDEKQLKEKVDKYFRMMHPDFANYSQEDELQALADEDFIKNNLGWVDREYDKFMNGRQPTSDRETMEYVMWHAKTEKYFSILHPNIATYSAQQRFDSYDDKNFIVENTEQVHSLFESYSKSGGLADKPEIDRLKNAMWHAKVSKYFNLLHPDFDSYPPQQREAALRDEDFLIDNTDAIHNLFAKEYSNAMSKKYMKDATDSEKIQAAIAEVRERLKAKEKKKITTKSALEYALSSGVTKEDTDRAQVAERQAEVTKENEGEMTNE